MTTDGPSPSRIIAAAGSVSAGIGLIALLAGSADPVEVVVQVEPTPVIVAPAPAPNTTGTGTADVPGPATTVVTPDPGLARPVEAATPPTTSAPAARVLATTEGS